jgi:hypothetical protein
LNDPDVKELMGLSRTAVKEGTSSKSEVDDLLKSAKTATQESQRSEDGLNDISEDDIAVLLEQLRNEQETVADKSLDAPEDNPESEKPDAPTSKSNVPDDSAEVAAILSQLTDASHLEQKFDESDLESPFPSVSGLLLPSVPKDSDDDLATRLAKLKTFPPKTYTGTDRGSINVFVPGISKTDDDETIHWCGMALLIVSINSKQFVMTMPQSNV